MEFSGDGFRGVIVEGRTVKARRLRETSRMGRKGRYIVGSIKPLYGLSTACRDWCEAIRDFLENVCVCVGGVVTSVGKSIFFWDQQGFGYGYGGEFRDPNSANLDKGILKANGNFETIDKSKVMGAIAIRVEDLLISGNDVVIEYISKRMKENPMWIDMEKIKSDLFGNGNWKSDRFKFRRRNS